MSIALNLLFVAPGVAGGSVYSERFLEALARENSGFNFDVYTRRDTRLPELPPEHFKQVRAPVGGSSVLWRTAWEYGVLPRRLRQSKCQIVHGLGSLSPPVKSCHLVLTIHDLIYLHFPRSVSRADWLFRRFMQPLAARRADRIIVPSKHSADDVVSTLGISREKIRVIPNGFGNPMTRVEDVALIESTLKKFGVRSPYIVSVGRGYPHKNLVGLLKAYAIFCDRQKESPQLVLVGDRYKSGRDVDRVIQELRLEDRVVFTGFVSNADLCALYSGAAMFAFSSLAEGFGLPVLEAMSCGTPVVCSNAFALPEVVGSAGVLANAADPEQFADAISRVFNDPISQDELRRRGLRRVEDFSWVRHVKDTLAVYRELL